ncbi:N-lysine methyltransferase setd6-like isoform X6 [Dreissena polymorpha]|uniref:N-lysine methyltransferase setd6-like isoform X6 n=1 Tax=Dreissena polymorpha TaxID=45954 RepID=UPI00226559CB|nr:N-lysine methyltransferase setd6-like isoform X6 [Dreissena polymorpha]
MAASMKRNALANTDENQDIKRSKITSDDKNLESFLSWAAENGFGLSDKVIVARESACAQYGMIAIADISDGETLFQIPRKMLLHPGTTDISDILEKERDKIQGSSGWAPLLISLMYEYTSEQSPWRPYFNLVPDFTELDLPMFWNKEDRNSLLKGSGVIEAVEKDLKNIEEEFTTIVLPFIKAHADIFHSQCQELEFYKKMVAFVMSYSFTEPASISNNEDEDDDDDDDEKSGSPPPMMVPMADILNHVAKNNAHLKFEKEALKMVAIKDIPKGEEVFNTYGELANWHLLHMYGFAERYPSNHWDTVEISSLVITQAIEVLSVNTQDTIKKKTSHLADPNLYGQDVGFILGVDGVLDEMQMCDALKVSCMNESQLEKRTQNEGWESDEEEEEGTSLCYDNFINLSKEWKAVLKRSAELTLRRYSRSIEEDKAMLQSSANSARQKYSLYTVNGQKMLLQKLINKCI